MVEDWVPLQWLQKALHICNLSDQHFSVIGRNKGANNICVRLELSDRTIDSDRT